jgi:nitrate/nitrite transporter NarK
MDGLNGAGGLAGWQWLFLLEGLPSVLLGFVVLAALPDRPADVRWLSAEEKTALSDALADEPADSSARHRQTLREAATDARVWWLSAIYFIFAMGLYGLTLWVPQIIKDVAGGSVLHVGLLTAVPYLLGAVCMVVTAQRTDRSGNHRRTLTLATVVAGLAFLAVAVLLDVGPVVTLAAISVAVMGLFSTFGPFWTLPSAFLRGTAAAGGIALINSIGNLGGFVSPWIVGLVKKQTGSFTGGIAFLAAALLVAAILVAVGTRPRVERAP